MMAVIGAAGHGRDRRERKPGGGAGRRSRTAGNVTPTMWIPLLMMAVAVSLEPFRIGMTVLMVNRPRPALQLVTFLIGGFAMGTAVGVIVLFVLRPAMGSAHVTLPRVQIVVGALLLAQRPGGGPGLVGRRGGEKPAGFAHAVNRSDARAAGHRPAQTAHRRVTVDGGRRGPRHRAAVGRLRRGAGAHRRLRRHRLRPSQRPGAVQRRGVRTGGDPAAGLRGGSGQDPRDACGAVRLAALTRPPRRRRPADRWSAACWSAPGSPDCRPLRLRRIVQHELRTGQQLRDRIGPPPPNDASVDGAVTSAGS